MSLVQTKFLLAGMYVLLFAIFALPYDALAVSPSSVSVNVNPTNYGPSENIIITISSFAANLDTVMITWFLEGKSSLSGVGEKSFSLTSGVAGSTTTVLVKISFPDGMVEKTISIRPNVMDLLWQASDSFVPPFYKGKALPSLESEIKVVAMPEVKRGGVLVSPKTMTYTWRKDYGNEADASGYGKNFFLYTGDYLEGINNIEVTVSTVDQQYSSTANTTIESFSPEIVFYKKDILNGIIWQTALEDGHFIKSGDNIVAMPYFISPKEIEIPYLVFNWFVNNTFVGLQGFRKNLIPLQVEDSASGASTIRLEIENSNKIFQTVNKEVDLAF